MHVSDLNQLSGKVKNWQKVETRYFLSLPRKSYILAIIAFLGLCTTFLPWADVVVGFYAQALAVGLHFFFGWLIFLVYLSIIIVLLFNKYTKLKEDIAPNVPFWGGIITVALSALFILWNWFDVQFGVYLCLLFSLIFLLTVLFYDKIFPKKRDSN
jgi:hypothetical protein